MPKGQKIYIFTLLGKLGIHPTRNELVCHDMLKGAHTPCKNNIEQASLWIDKIRQSNKKTGIFPEPALTETLAQQWFQFCNSFWYDDSNVWKIFVQNPVSEYIALPLKQKAKFFIKCHLHINRKRDLLKGNVLKYL